MKFKLLFFIIGLTLTLVSCDKKDYSQYISTTNSNRSELEQLFPLLDEYKNYSENRFTVMSEIISKMLNDKSIGRLNLFISDYIDNNPEDPYNSYYMLSLASCYLKNGQNNFAIPYLHKSVMSYNDLIIREESTHFKALEILVKISPNEHNKVFYYKKLINEHEERVEKKDVYTGGIGELYYDLGKSLEKIEKWDDAIIAYENYLNRPDSAIQSEPEARDETLKKVGFYHSDKTWVVKDLETLIKRVKYALTSRNPGLLDKYRAYDFFIINWQSKYTDLKSSYPMESYVLTNMNIKTARNLDPMSTESEAYLEVSGNPWSSSIWYVYPKWYFYFKKVDYPMDPEINGGWEWIGIFLGEKL